MLPDWKLPAGTDRGLWNYVTSEQLAREYDDALAGTPLLDIDLKFADEYLRSPGRAVDLGCGTGRLLMHLAKRGFSGVGVDLSEGMLAVLSEKAKVANVAIECVNANLVDLSVLETGSFDYAACLFSTLGMIRGAANRQSFLNHVRRILKPGGLFILHAHNVRYRCGRGLGKKGTEPGDRMMAQHRGGAELTLHHFTRRELEIALKQSGFDIREIRPVTADRDGKLKLLWFFPTIRTYGYLIAAD